MSSNAPARRNFLRGLASLPVIGGAALASATSATSATAFGSDTVATLKAAYLDARSRYDAAEVALDRHWTEYVDLACSNRDSRLSDDEHIALVNEFARNTGMEPAFEAQDQSATDMDAMFDRAMTLPASAEKLALLAFLIKDFQVRDYWRDAEDERDAEERRVTQFVDCILADAGVAS